MTVEASHRLHPDLLCMCEVNVRSGKGEKAFFFFRCGSADFWKVFLNMAGSEGAGHVCWMLQ